MERLAGISTYEETNGKVYTAPFLLGEKGKLDRNLIFRGGLVRKRDDLFEWGGGWGGDGGGGDCNF